MIIAGPSLADTGSYAVLDPPQSQPVCTSSSFDIEKPLDVELDQRYFVFGDKALSLEHNLTLLAYPRLQQFEIKGWNIRLPFDQVGNISRVLVRKFLLLLRKADMTGLSPAEKEEWSDIISQVDYQKYCIEHNAPVYVEGRLNDITSKGFEIEWHTGIVEHVPKSNAKALDLINKEEYFCGMAKLGQNNQLLSLADVFPLPTIETDGEKMWQSWPSNRSL